MWDLFVNLSQSFSAVTVTAQIFSDIGLPEFQRYLIMWLSPFNVRNENE